MEEGGQTAETLRSSSGDLDRLGPRQAGSQVGGNLESIRAALLIGFIFRFVLKRVKRERKPVRRTDSKLWRKQQTGENSDTKYVICHKRKEFFFQFQSYFQASSHFETRKDQKEPR